MKCLKREFGNNTVEYPSTPTHICISHHNQNAPVSKNNPISSIELTCRNMPLDNDKREALRLYNKG
jgi:hypothetical protein